MNQAAWEEVEVNEVLAETKGDGLLKERRYRDWVDEVCFGTGSDLDLAGMLGTIRQTRREIAPNYWKGVAELDDTSDGRTPSRFKVEGAQLQFANEVDEMKRFEMESMAQLRERLRQQQHAFFQGWEAWWGNLAQEEKKYDGRRQTEGMARRQIEEYFTIRGMKQSLIPEGVVRGFLDVTRESQRLLHWFDENAVLDQEGQIDEEAMGRFVFRSLSSIKVFREEDRPSGKVRCHLGDPPCYIEVVCENPKDIEWLWDKRDGAKGYIAGFMSQEHRLRLSRDSKTLEGCRVVVVPEDDPGSEILEHERQHVEALVRDRDTGGYRSLLKGEDSLLAGDEVDQVRLNSVFTLVKDEMLAFARSGYTWEEAFRVLASRQEIYLPKALAIMGFSREQSRGWKDRLLWKRRSPSGDEQEMEKKIRKFLKQYFQVMNRWEEGLLGYHKQEEYQIHSKSVLRNRRRMVGLAMHLDFGECLMMANLFDPKRMELEQERLPKRETAKAAISHSRKVASGIIGNQKLAGGNIL